MPRVIQNDLSKSILHGPITTTLLHAYHSYSFHNKTINISNMVFLYSFNILLQVENLCWPWLNGWPK